VKFFPYKVGLWVLSGIEKNVKDFHKNKKEKNDLQKVKYKFKK